MILATHGIQRMQARAQATGIGGQHDFANHPLQAKPVAECLPQQVQADAIARRQPDRAALVAALVDACTRAFDAVDLVEDHQLRDLAGADFGQDLIDLADAFVPQRIVGIDHVQQQVGFARLAQGRAERGDQFMRQVAHETDGIGEHHAAAGQLDPAHGRVKRGEQLVGGVGIRTGQRIEQRRLAGIGVADQRHPRQFAAHPRAAHLGVLDFHFLQPLLQHVHALLQQPAVGFQLGFAGAAQADRTTALALQVGPAAHQARGHVLELRQLDLQLAFGAARALRKDVQDQAGAVDHAALQRTLQVALLDRAQADG